MGLRPMFAFVLVEREKLTNSAIIIPEAAQKANAKARGKVVEIGPDADERIKIGGTYIFGKYAGDWVNAEGKSVASPDEAEYYILKDEDLLCEVI